MIMDIITIHNLKKYYGSGKTTLLNMMGGLVKGQIMRGSLY